nr:hypothetical protein BgiMline_030742 [Biomphalaria glabrata]
MSLCQLSLLNGTEAINSSQVCSLEFSSKECRPFLTSFDRNDLPAVFCRRSPATVKPSYLNVTLKNSDYISSNEKYIYPGLIIEWSAPDNDNALSQLEGFLMVWQSSQQQYCRLFRFSNRTDLFKKARFQYQVQYINTLTEYTIKVYSLPPPERPDQPEFFVSQTISSFDGYKSVRGPIDWTPRIIMAGFNDGSLTAWFTLAPKEFKITTYRVLLVHVEKDPSNFAQEKTYTANSYSTYNATVRFENLVAGTYYVVIQVIDLLANITDQCICFMDDPRETSKKCQALCSSVMSETLVINSTAQLGQGGLNRDEMVKKASRNQSDGIYGVSHFLNVIFIYLFGYSVENWLMEV